MKKSLDFDRKFFSFLNGPNNSMKKKYKVHVKEVHILTFEVEADNDQDAKMLANDIINNEDISRFSIEYSHTLPIEDWGVNEIK